MIITHKLEMDMTGQGPVPQIHAVQNDSNTRVLEAELFSGSEPWSVPEPVSISLRYCKPDGTRGLYNTLPDGSRAWSVSGNRVSMVLAPQMLTVDGLVLAQLELTQGDSILATFMIRVNVERNVAAGVLQSEDYVNMLHWVTAELDRCLAEAKESGLFDGPQGTPGPRGEPGEPGMGPYDYAVSAGYAGSEPEFMQHYITPCLPLSGGTMSGDITMDGRRVSGLADPETDSDAASKAYVDSRSMSVVKVWENASPDSSFAAQTIILDLTDAKFLLVRSRVLLDQDYSVGWIAFMNVSNMACALSGYSGTFFSRYITLSVTGVRFSGAYKDKVSTNDAYIPMEIYVIR